MKTTDENKRILEIINSLKTSEVFFLFNYINETEKIKVEVDFIAAEEKNQHIILKPKADSVEHLNLMMEYNEKITLFCPRRSLSFITTVVEFQPDNNNLLILGFPPSIIFYERREVPRAKLSKPLRVEFPQKYNLPLINCYDLGHGGFSVFFTTSVKPSFKKNEKISKVRLPDLSENFFLDVEVLNLILTKPYELEEHPYEGLRVSFKINELDEDSFELIKKYMNEYSLFKYNFQNEDGN